MLGGQVATRRAACPPPSRPAGDPTAASERVLRLITAPPTSVLSVGRHVRLHHHPIYPPPKKSSAVPAILTQV